MTGTSSKTPMPPPAPNQAGGRWGDLGLRLMSSLVLAGLGVLSMALGGWVFFSMTVLIFALMAWELAALSDTPAQPLARMGIAALAGLGLALAQLQGWALVALAFAPLALALTPRRDARLIAAYSLAMLLSAHVFIALDHRGAVIVVWLVCIVVASDVFGYFAGRLLGGPKVWPSISPKKTWSGTVAGWLGAGLVGLGFVLVEGAGWGLLAISPLVALASQLGDIAESLLKRRAGVKDASRLIPGHGGVIDRFDAMIGAILAVWLLELVVPLPLGAAL
jgi:phosphatidate cytidylyltransferase